MSADDDTRVLVSTIWARRRDDVLARVRVIEAALDEAGDEPRRAEAARQAHMLAGSAGTYGFARASELARVLEQALGSGAPPDDTLRAAAAELRELLEGEPEP